MFPQKCFVFAKYVVLLICNIWKHLCWTYFYNLVASFRRVQQQKTFVMLSRLGSGGLDERGGGGLSEYTVTKNVAVTKM